jgi:hypothetical protein
MRSGRLTNIPKHWKPMTAIRFLEIKGGNGNGYNMEQIIDRLSYLGENITQKEITRYFKKWDMCIEVSNTEKYSIKERYKSFFTRYLEDVGIVDVDVDGVKIKPHFL